MSDFVASTPLAVGLLALAGLLLLGLGVACARNRLLLLMGLRNMWRRPAQTTLLLVGLTFSTVLIVSSFGLNDSLTYSAQQQVRQETGQFDGVATDSATELEDRVVPRNRCVALVLLHVSGANDGPCLRTAASHPSEVDRDVEPGVVKSWRIGLVLRTAISL